jgi:membrane protease YdiL (CAAX protease family)
LLYRGVLFELAERGWPQGRGRSPITASTVPFALQHFQFHGYRLSAAALLQVGFTIPMGLVFGRLRRDSGSLWPGFAVHVVTNLTGAFGGAP